MLTALRASWTLFLGLAFIMLGNGLQGTLLGVRASLEGFSTYTTGVIIAGYFIGFLVGSSVIPRLIGNVGHIRVFAALASLASVSVLIHSVAIYPAVWVTMRLITGLSYSGLYIVAESWINDLSTNQTRGKLLAIYMMVSMGGMAISQSLLNLSSPQSADLFILVSILVSLALVPISLLVVTAPQIQPPKRTKLIELYRVSPLGIVTMFGSGIVAGALLGMGAFAASLLGLSVAHISIFMSALLFGSMTLLYPIGWLSDLFDRRLVITVISLVSGLVALVLVVIHSGLMLYALIALLGALSVPLYSLAIAHTNDHLETDQMVAASGSLVMVNGIGASIGPLAAATAMDQYGAIGLFIVLAAVQLAIGVFALYRMTRRAPAPIDEQGSMVVMPPRGTPIVAGLAAEEVIESSEAGEESAAAAIASPSQRQDAKFNPNP